MSFIDRLVVWGSTQRVPWWALALSWWLLLGFLFNAVKWIDGSLAVGEIGRLTLDAFYFPFSIVAFGFLRNASDAAFRRYAPALDLSATEFEAARVQFVTTRQRPAVVAGMLGAAFGALTVLADAGQREVVGSSVLTATVLGFGSFTLGYGSGGILSYRIIRILRDVGRLHREAKGVELFDTTPAHALSGLTSAAGITLILGLTYSAATDPTTFTSGPLVALTVTGMGLAVVTFVAPLLGMRARLRVEKSEMTVGAVTRLRKAVRDMESAVDRGKYQEVAPIRDAVVALEAEVARIKAASTWPWDSHTVRGFSSALLLPVLTWLLTVGIGKVIGV